MFSSKVSSSSLLLVAVLIAVLGFSGCGSSLVSNAQAQDPAGGSSAAGCSVVTLNGTYGVLEQGTVLLALPIPGTPPPPFPFATTVVATFDGGGKFWGKWTGSFGGVIVPGTFAGTYQIKPDCSYTDEFSPLPGLTAHHAGVIAGRGMFQELQFMYTDPFGFGTGTSKKIPGGGCSQETLKGTYAILGDGTDVNIPLPGFTPPFPMGHVATLTADGAGNLSGGGMENTSGFVFPATYAGTYTVNPDCTVSFVIADTALGTTMTLPLLGTMTGEGRYQELRTISTSPGAVFADTWTKQ